MPKKKYKAEEIINILRQVEILVSQGQTAQIAVRGMGISEQTYYPERIWWDAHRPGAEAQGTGAGKQQIKKNSCRPEQREIQREMTTLGSDRGCHHGHGLEY